MLGDDEIENTVCQIFLDGGYVFSGGCFALSLVLNIALLCFATRIL